MKLIVMRIDVILLYSPTHSSLSNIGKYCNILRMTIITTHYSLYQYISIEDFSIYLNSKSLTTFAKRNKGNYYDFKDYKMLLDNLKFSLVKVLNKFEISTLSYYKLWFIVIFLLITEWIIRKRKGLL